MLTAAVAFVAGCGGGVDTGPEAGAVDTGDPIADIRVVIADVAQSGTVSSNMQGVPELIAKVSDDAKRAKLEEQYATLIQGGKPEDVKKVANEMLATLDS